MRELGVPARESHLLSYLRSYAPCRVGELGRVFGLKRSTLTSMLDRLERRGLLLRTLDGEDRRSLLVELTRRGKPLADRINTLVDRFERRALAAIPRRDLAGFEAVMRTVADITRVEVRPGRRART